MTSPQPDARQQLEDVIDRQLAAQNGVTFSSLGYSRAAAIEASKRAILAAVDEWAAGQIAAAVTPQPAIVMPRKLTRRAARRLRKQFLAAQGQFPTVLPEVGDDTTTGGTR